MDRKTESALPIRGRGASGNLPNRFDRLRYEVDVDDETEEPPHPATEYLVDSSRSLIAYNDSPDVGFSASINPYRGCEHGCIYCYARPTHEYLSFSAGLDFETKILVKNDAPELLRAELGATRWRPQTLGISGVTDCYQPIERRLQLTRRCLEVLAEFRNPAVIITKSKLVTRDLDLLKELALHKAVAVCLSVTSLDDALSRKLEPRAARPEARIEAIRILADAGIPTGVLVAPIIPGLTEHMSPAILAAAARAGASFAGYVMLRLPFAVAPLFEAWLQQHYPDAKDKVLGRIRDMRGGRLNDPRFKVRMHGEGRLAESIHDIFRMGRRKAGIAERFPHLSAASFRAPGPHQLQLFS